MDEHFKLLDQVTDTAVDLGLKFGPKLLVAALIVIAGYVAGSWAARGVRRALGRFQLEPPVRSLIERIVRVLVLGLFFILALQNLGVELLPLIAGLGVAGAGIALAMQGVLGNVVAGLTIIFVPPFRVGDYISIVKEEGEVLDITLFSTTLGHSDKSQVVIPNRKIVGEILHNYGRIRQLAVEVGVSYGTDVNAAVAAIREILRANQRVLNEPAAAVSVSKLGDSSVTIAVGPWVSAPHYGAVSSEVNQAILETFRARGIEIPFPQREIRMVSANAGLREGTGERLAGRDAA